MVRSQRDAFQLFLVLSETSVLSRPADLRRALVDLYAAIGAAASYRVCGIRVHGTGLRCTSFHRFQAATVFYPFFYPKRQRSGVEML